MNCIYVQSIPQNWYFFQLFQNGDFGIYCFSILISNCRANNLFPLLLFNPFFLVLTFECSTIWNIEKMEKWALKIFYKYLYIEFTHTSFQLCPWNVQVLHLNIFKCYFLSIHFLKQNTYHAPMEFAVSIGDFLVCFIFNYWGYCPCKFLLLSLNPDGKSWIMAQNPTLCICKNDRGIDTAWTLVHQSRVRHG